MTNRSNRSRRSNGSNRLKPTRFKPFKSFNHCAEPVLSEVEGFKSLNITVGSTRFRRASRDAAVQRSKACPGPDPGFQVKAGGGEMKRK